MKNLIILLILTKFLLFISNSVLFSQAPQAIPYQAVARNNSGSIIANQNISIRFSIHNSASNGIVIYRETQNVPTNNLGLFNVNIGEGTPSIGTFAGIDWGNGAKFVEIEIDPSGGTNYNNLGTVQLMSVPYALFAGNVASSSANNFGDIKQSFRITDHDGWVKLDGRLKTNLTSSQQSQATSLGIGISLPDATNAVLVQNGTIPGTVTGSNERTIAQNQLPNITLSGTSSSSGSHTHSIAVNDNGVIAVSTGNVTAMKEAYSNWTSGPATYNANVIGSGGGNHSHTFTTSSMNGNVTQQNLDITPKSLSVNTFIYLGN